jgi:peptidoglycan/LPS O-acetylase OafA/YrhL
LRFFAFFLVFLSHVVPGEAAFYERAHIPPQIATWIVAAAAGGAFGVDLFFTLSSFLITTLLLREHEARGSIDTGSFYIRRILRIWPLYFVFLFLVVPLVPHIVADDRMPPGYMLAYALLAGNWACAWWGYPHSVASPLWSVSIEEQFYLSWPLVMRGWMKHPAIVAAAVLVVSLATRLWLVSRGAVHPEIWCNTLARLDPFACGALLAVYAKRNEIAAPLWLRVLLLLFGCAVLTAAGRYGDFVGTKALITFPAVTAACVALMVGTLGAQMDPDRMPLVRGLTYLGRISYGLYVFHAMFVIGLGVQSVHGPIARPTVALEALLASIAVAAVSYRFLETPFLRWKERFTRIASRPV